MLKVTSLLPACLLLAAELALSGCAETAGIAPSSSADATTGGGREIQQSFSHFPDIPIPSGAKIEVDKTLVFGSGETWTGRLVMSSSHSAFQMFDFFKQELPGFGWQEITSVRAKSSVLTYSRHRRIAIIQIDPSTLGGSEVALTVSPRGADQPPGAAPPLPAPVEPAQ